MKKSELMDTFVVVDNLVVVEDCFVALYCDCFIVCLLLFFYSLY